MSAPISATTGPGIGGERTMLGAPFQPAPGLLVLSPSRLRDFDQCRQRFHLTHVLGMRSAQPDHIDSTATGLQVHAELDARHRQLDLHDHPDMVDPHTPDDPAVRRAIGAHLSMCPVDEAQYLGGELELRWYVPAKAVLVTGRVDALWRYPDGTVEVRDYKTGAVPEHLDDDPGALLYAVLAAAQPPAPARLRVVYERLGGEHPGIVTLQVDAALLRRAQSAVVALADGIRKERTFPATPHPGVCPHCPYALTCPDADRGQH